MGSHWDLSSGMDRGGNIAIFHCQMIFFAPAACAQLPIFVRRRTRRTARIGQDDKRNLQGM
jgi:hypothetical protein